MAKQTQIIKIESILGGQSPSTHFAAPDQFLSSFGIDPTYGLDDGSSGALSESCGLLRPVGVSEDTPGSITGAPLWISAQPKAQVGFYVYDANGSVYSVSGNTVSGVGDLNDGGTAKGNGMAYYDNYMYFARETTIARYGPLDGSPIFTDDYWVGTLSKTALSQPLFPALNGFSSVRAPNHVMHRHSDGKLYVADVVGGQGTIHYIKTRKTTVEGDTDDGSTYDKVHVGLGLFPTCIESYGSDLVITFIEGDSVFGYATSVDSVSKAKVAFWDTTSQNINSITWVEFPDNYISAVKNINGVLHFFSGNFSQDGYRVLKYIGGSSFEEVFFSSIGTPPHPGAVDGQGNRLVFGSKTESPLGENGCVWQLGSRNSVLGTGGLFNVRATSTKSDFAIVTAVRLDNGDDFNRSGILTGFADPFSADYGIDDSFSAIYGTSATEWYSQIYKIGQPFKITKIRIPLAQKLTSQMRVLPYVWIDGIDDTVPDYKTLTEINSTNYGTNARTITIRPQNMTGDYSFMLSLEWLGTALCVVGLPITIEYELLDVDAAKP